MISMVDWEKKRHIGVVVVFLLVFIVFLNQPYFIWLKPYVAWFLGSGLLLYAYLTGIIALGTGVLAGLFSFLVTLPFIAPVYAFFMTYWLFISQKIFGYLFNQILRQFPPVKRFIDYIKTSNGFIWFNDRVTLFFTKIGLKQQKKILFFEVAPCPHCMQDIPIESKACMYCKKEVIL